jgi:pimeloyl-ACP methyl ester carboxylesterase
VTGLAVLQVGSGPVRFVFAHGLFGRGRTWSSVAKRLLPAASLLVDLPDHGDSAWTDRFSYTGMAHALGATLADVGERDLTLVGHSMGGRTAMLTALGYPELVRRLVVVDVAPAATPSPAFAGYAAAMLALTPEQMATRREAAAALTGAIPDRRVREFLLTGYRAGPEGGGWQFNLPVLARDLALALDWPDPGPVEPYRGPVLWVKGGNSDYIRPESHALMRELFPRVELVVIPGAGHWVQADAPQAFTTALTGFVAANDR